MSGLQSLNNSVTNPYSGAAFVQRFVKPALSLSLAFGGVGMASWLASKGNPMSGAVLLAAMMPLAVWTKVCVDNETMYSKAF